MGHMALIVFLIKNCDGPNEIMLHVDMYEEYKELCIMY